MKTSAFSRFPVTIYRSPAARSVTAPSRTVPALSVSPDRAPLGMLAFDCAGRRGVLGHEGIKKEIRGLSVAAGGAPLAGFTHMVRSLARMAHAVCTITPS